MFFSKTTRFSVRCRTVYHLLKRNATETRFPPPEISSKSRPCVRSTQNGQWLAFFVAAARIGHQRRPTYSKKQNRLTARAYTTRRYIIKKNKIKYKSPDHGSVGPTNTCCFRRRKSSHSL